jgi:hypothetical protein
VRVQDPIATGDEQVTIASPAAGVIEDARSRQRRHRRAGAAVSVAVALTTALAYLNAGGGNGSAPTQPRVSKGGAAFVQTANLRSPRGRTTSTFIVIAPADHAFDVNIEAPSAAAVALTTNFGFSGPTFHTLTDRQDCRTLAATTTCALHFAAGGNAGGTWKWTVTKTSIPGARIEISVAFNPHLGDYPG